MRDGVELVADVYEPAGDVVGTLLARGPYGRAFPFSLVFADLHAARGYRVILQSVRGTFGSGGDFSPMVNEAADGADTVEWMRRQPWFTGRFATIGISYLGFTQFALLQDPPPELVTSVIVAGPARYGPVGMGHRLVRRQRLPGLEQSGGPPGGSGPDPRRHPPTSGPETRRAGRRRGAAGRCRPDPARRRRAMVGVLADTPGGRQPVLGPVESRLRPRSDPGAVAAAQRLARPVPAADAAPVPAPSCTAASTSH